MKTTKDLRTIDNDADNVIRKAAKLAPIKKSGKERHNLYSALENDDDDYQDYKKRESVLDYFDDMAEEEEINQDQLEDEVEDNWEEYRDDHGDEADLGEE